MAYNTFSMNLQVSRVLTYFMDLTCYIDFSYWFDIFFGFCHSITF